jgi:hypothetical protein
MATIINGLAIADAVARDGLPRQAIADDDSRHVLYLDSEMVRSMRASDWPLPLPADPTEAEIAAALSARQAADQQAAADAAALRTRVRQIAQGTVGVQIDQLTAIQVRALIAVLLHKASAIDASGAIKPLTEWT